MSLRDTALSDMAESKRQLGAQITEQYKLIDELRAELASVTWTRNALLDQMSGMESRWKRMTLWGHVKAWWSKS